MKNVSKKVFYQRKFKKKKSFWLEKKLDFFSWKIGKFYNFVSSFSSEKTLFWQVDPDAFKAVMDYIYTGRLETSIALVDECLRLAVQFNLDTLDSRLTMQKAQANFFGKKNLLRQQSIWDCSRLSYASVENGLKLLDMIILTPKEQAV